MMAAMNITLLTELGYDFASTQGYDNPDGTEFAAVAFSAEAYANDAKHSAVRSLGSLNAYQPASTLMAAQASYYAANGNKQNPATIVVTQTASVAPSSAGEGFSSSVTSEALPGFEALETVNLVAEIGVNSTLLRREAEVTSTSVGRQTLARPTPSPATTVAPS
jgi:hypothetical protein